MTDQFLERLVKREEAENRLKAVAGEEYMKYLRQAAMLAAVNATDDEVSAFCQSRARGDL